MVKKKKNIDKTKRTETLNPHDSHFDSKKTNQKYQQKTYFQSCDKSFDYFKAHC